MPQAPTQKQIDALASRRHPEYEGKEGHWEFLSETYVGGRDWFKKHIFQYLKEGDTEYSDRVDRAYRFNHSREVVDLVSKYIFKSHVARKVDAVSEEVREFWNDCTIGGANINQYIRTLSDKSSIYGKIWVVVDSSKGGTAQSVAEAREDGGRIYSYVVPPTNALDMSFDDFGELNWILLYEEVRDDEDPFGLTKANQQAEQLGRYRLWTRNEWYLFGVDPDTESSAIEMLDYGEHGLGVVPVFDVDHITTDESMYTSPSLIGDIAYLDRSVANYLSNLDAIIQDQTFSQLAMPAQGVLPGDENFDQLVEMGTKRIFLYDGENGSKPFFLSPDPKQAEMIIVVIRQIINEIYHTVGMAGERTKQDNAVGIDNSSGVAKAYDFERVNALLTSKAGMLLKAELKLVKLVDLWSGVENPTYDEDVVVYPETFDTRGLFDEFTIASQLSLVNAPKKVRRKQMEQVIDKLFPNLAEPQKAEMKGELDDWLEMDEMESQPPSPNDNQSGGENDDDDTQDTE